jgi:hypothetical protein
MRAGTGALWHGKRVLELPCQDLLSPQTAPGGADRTLFVYADIPAYVGLAATVWPRTKGPIVRSQGLFAPPACRLKKTMKPLLVLVPPRRVFAEKLMEIYLRLESIKQD